MFVPLSTLADVRLGYKSLQNTFFYVNRDTIEAYDIEEQYLTPILMRRAMDSQSYLQVVEPNQWLFNCRERKEDIRATGAWKYVEAMSGLAANRKKQSGKYRTIKEALEAQGGGIWYSPKARPRQHRIWVRKAIDGVFAPYLFTDPVLVDQRFNSISPADDIDWEELAAVLTSTLFAYSVEINGAASMGAGALEAPTRKLREYPVLNIRSLSGRDRKALVYLAEKVWEYENTVDWSAEDCMPQEALQELDKWLLMKCAREVPLQRLYEDLRSVCRSRIAVARDKVKKIKKRQADSIGSVAESIAKAILPKMETRNFPEDFIKNAHSDMSFSFERRSISRITIAQLLNYYDISVMTKSGETVYESSFVQPIAEGIIRALLWGRSTFSVSGDRGAMSAAVADFIIWVASIERDIDKRITDSALGTGYEAALKVEVLSRLGIHPMAGAKVLPDEILI